jgi:hypothetical protein
MSDRQKTVPRGRALAWTAEELDEMSIITPEVIEAAKQAVQRDNPKLARLLEAALVE